jgi:hypothetical protein
LPDRCFWLRGFRSSKIGNPGKVARWDWEGNPGANWENLRNPTFGLNMDSGTQFGIREAVTPAMNDFFQENDGECKAPTTTI